MPTLIGHSYDENRLGFKSNLRDTRQSAAYHNLPGELELCR
jgi:hypothetical protein